MSRDLTTAMQAAVADSVVRLGVLVEGQFVSGVSRLWTGIGPLDWNGHTWTGAGNLLSFSTFSETADLRATGMSISMAGIQSNVALVLSECRRRLPVTVWIACFDAAGAMIADPFISFGGLLDVADIEDAGDHCTVRITYESELIELDRPRVRRYTHQDQQERAPGDRFFEYVVSLQDQALEW